MCEYCVKETMKINVEIKTPEGTVPWIFPSQR